MFYFLLTVLLFAASASTTPYTTQGDIIGEVAHYWAQEKDWTPPPSVRKAWPNLPETTPAE
jgi:hypothetical protein